MKTDDNPNRININIRRKFEMAFIKENFYSAYKSIKKNEASFN